MDCGDTATQPEPEQVLAEFYRKVRPSFGWRPVAGRLTHVLPDRDLSSNLVCWLAGCVLVYGALFGVGKVILKEPTSGAAMLAVAFAAGAVIFRNLSRRGWRAAIE